MVSENYYDQFPAIIQLWRLDTEEWITSETILGEKVWRYRLGSPQSARNTETLSSSMLLSLRIWGSLKVLSSSVYWSTLKMVAIWSSETSVSSQWTLQRYIPEDISLHVSKLFLRLLQIKYNYHNSEKYPFYLKRDFSETVSCPLIQVEPTQVGPIDRASLCLRAPPTTPIGLHLKTETECSLENVVF
jgi:hypothetical protein